MRDELLRDLEKLQGWPEKVRVMHRTGLGAAKACWWILIWAERWGRRDRPITVFTTRVDTILWRDVVEFGAGASDCGDLVARNSELRGQVENLIAEAAAG